MSTISLKKAKDVQGTSTAKTKKTDAKNVKNIKEKVAKVKDLMYRYPAEILDSPDGKKKFRAAARRKLESARKALTNAKDREKVLAKVQKWAAKTYTKESMPQF